VQPLEFVVLAVAGAVGALVTVVAVGASLLLVLPIAVLVGGIGHAIASDPGDDTDQHVHGRGFDEPISG
jgi:hypothetical protein